MNSALASSAHSNSFLRPKIRAYRDPFSEKIFAPTKKTSSSLLEIIPFVNSFYHSSHEIRLCCLDPSNLHSKNSSKKIIETRKTFDLSSKKIIPEKTLGPNKPCSFSRLGFWFNIEDFFSSQWFGQIKSWPILESWGYFSWPF